MSSNRFSASFSTKTPLKIYCYLLMSHVLFNPIQEGFLALNLVHVNMTSKLLGQHLTYLTSLKYSCVLTWLLRHRLLLELPSSYN